MCPQDWSWRTTGAVLPQEKSGGRQAVEKWILSLQTAPCVPFPTSADAIEWPSQCVGKREAALRTLLTLLFRLVKILRNHRKEVISKSTPIILKISIKLPSSTTTLFGQDFRILLTSLEPFIFLLFDFACAENSFLRMDWSERE